MVSWIKQSERIFVEEVKEFTYLGGTATEDGDSTQEIRKEQ